MKKHKKIDVKKYVITGLLIAITFLLGLTPVGIIPLGFINVTIMCLPVLVGTLVVGLGEGMIMGAAFGIASTLSAMGLSLTPPSALASQLLGASPVLLIIMCLVPRLLIPVTSYFVNKLITKNGTVRIKSGIGVAAAVGSLTNTIIYLGLMLLFFHLTGLDSAAILAIIGGTGLIAGGSEAVVAVLVCTPVVIALRAFLRKR